MDQKLEIIDLHVSGVSNRKIARNKRISRRIVDQYVAEFEAKKAELHSMGRDADTETIILEMYGEPKYDSSGRKARKVTPEIIEEIKSILAENKEKAHDGRKKQQMTIQNIVDHFKTPTFKLSYGTVWNIVKSLTEEADENTVHEVFIKQVYDAGTYAQFDFGYACLDIGGTGFKQYPMAVFSLPYSNYRFARVFYKADEMMLIEMHVRFFAHCNGVFHEIAYDNAKIQVAKTYDDGTKEASRGLKKLSSYYGFNYRFCNARRGNEKAYVENGVKVCRNAAFTEHGADKYDTLEDANRHLDIVVNELNGRVPKDGVAPAEKLKDEQPHLLTLPADFDCSYRVTCRVNKYSFIQVINNHYSVLENYVGKMVEARIFTNKIVVYSKDGKVIAEHERCYEKGKDILDIYHYPETMKRKPGAIRGSLQLSQSDIQLKQIYEDYYTDTPRNFPPVLEIIREKSVDLVRKALRRLMTVSPADLSPDKVREYCDLITDEKTEAKTGTDSISRIAEGTLEQYDLLMKEQNKSEVTS